MSLMVLSFRNSSIKKCLSFLSPLILSKSILKAVISSFKIYFMKLMRRCDNSPPCYTLLLESEKQSVEI